MLLWRLPNQRNRIWLLIIRLVTIVMLIHAMIIFCIFFLYQTTMLQFVCTSNPTAFMHQRFVKHEAAIGLVNRPHAKRVASSFVTPKTVKQSSKKIVPDIKEPKKIEQKAVTPSKPIQKQEVPKPKAELKKEKIEQKAEKKELETEKDSVSVPIIEQNNVQESLSVADENSAEKKYISARERDEQQRISLLQEIISTQWHPPVGSVKSAFCTVSFVVGATGLAEKVTIVESSKILLFDMSVRSALRTISLPGWARGKLLTITFKE